jgi:predicted nucleotidyltransferase
LGSHIQRILTGNLVGLFLYGSLTTGDFDPEHSDIDLLAATALDLTSTEFEQLWEMHHDFAFPASSNDPNRDRSRTVFNNRQ